MEGQSWVMERGLLVARLWLDFSLSLFSSLSSCEGLSLCLPSLSLCLTLNILALPFITPHSLPHLHPFYPCVPPPIPSYPCITLPISTNCLHLLHLRPVNLFLYLHLHVSTHSYRIFLSTSTAPTSTTLISYPIFLLLILSTFIQPVSNQPEWWSHYWCNEVYA